MLLVNFYKKNVIVVSLNNKVFFQQRILPLNIIIFVNSAIAIEAKVPVFFFFYVWFILARFGLVGIYSDKFF
jgi:hypothetical protein